jgi:hypothetical protein
MRDLTYAHPLAGQIVRHAVILYPVVPSSWELKKTRASRLGSVMLVVICIMPYIYAGGCLRVRFSDLEPYLSPPRSIRAKGFAHIYSLQEARRSRPHPTFTVLGSPISLPDRGDSPLMNCVTQQHLEHDPSWIHPLKLIGTLKLIRPHSRSSPSLQATNYTTPT